MKNFDRNIIKRGIAAEVDSPSCPHTNWWKYRVVTLPTNLFRQTSSKAAAATELMLLNSASALHSTDASLVRAAPANLFIEGTSPKQIQPLLITESRWHVAFPHQTCGSESVVGRSSHCSLPNHAGTLPFRIRLVDPSQLCQELMTGGRS